MDVRKISREAEGKTDGEYAGHADCSVNTIIGNDPGVVKPYLAETQQTWLGSAAVMRRHSGTYGNRNARPHPHNG